MSYRQARRLQDRVSLDNQVRIVRFDAIDPVTGRYAGSIDPATGDYVAGRPATDEQVWCLRQDGRSEVTLGRDGCVLNFPFAVVIRWDAKYQDLSSQAIRVTFPERPDEHQKVHNVELIGRRRFLRLEV